MPVQDYFSAYTQRQSTHCQCFDWQRSHICHYLFAFLHTNSPFERVYSKRKGVLSRSHLEGSKTVLADLFSLKVYLFSIRKTCLYNFDPIKPHFYIVKLGFAGVYIIFVISAENIDCGYSLEPPRRGGSNEYLQSMFSVEIWKVSEFFIWKILVFWRWNFPYIWIGVFS